jgi:hypothetical protein
VNQTKNHAIMKERDDETLSDGYMAMVLIE